MKNQIDPNKDISYKFINDNLHSVNRRVYMRLYFINIVISITCIFICSVVVNLLFHNITIPSFILFNNSNISHISKKIRRDIVDRHGNKIVMSIPSLNLYVNSRKIQNSKDTAKKLIKIFPDLSYDYLISVFNNKRSFTYIKRKLPIKLEAKIRNINDDGIGLEKIYERTYPHNELFSHIIGNVDIDNNGISGIEKGLNNLIVKNDPKPVQLSLDIRIQEIIRTVLLDGLDKYGAKSGAAIFMNIHTGEILSLISLPDYNPKKPSITLSDSKYNNHITFDTYEHGSVFKVFTSALAINNGFTDIDPIPIYDVGKPFKIGNKTIHEEFIFQRYVKFSDILVKSSNIASARVGLELGSVKQQEFYSKLGFFDYVHNIEIPELSKPIYKSPEAWDDEVVATAAYGYGLAVTPLHTIIAFNAVVNDGIMIYPTLLKVNKKVEDLENSYLNKHNRIVSLSTSKLLRKWLRETVTKNNKKYIDAGNIKIGGKTGTAEKLVNGKYSNDLFRTFFIVTFPIDNPKYSMLVLLDEPTKNENGFLCRLSGCNVVPLTKEILKKLAVYLVLD